MKTLPEHHATAGAIGRKYAPVKDWLTISGMGHSTFYELVKDGKLRAIKLGAKTLVDVEHGLAWMATLPPVQSKSAPNRAA